MKVVVINLDQRTDRLELFDRNNPNLQYERFKAVDGSMISYQKLLQSGYDVNHDWIDPILHTKLTKGEVGCFLSHWHIWQKCIERNESLIVLEDDAILTERFDMEEVESLPFDFVYLAYHEMGNGIKITDKLSVPVYPYWTLAYMIRPDAARKLINNEAKRNIFPVDEYLPTMMKSLNVAGYTEDVVKAVSRSVQGSNVLAHSRYDYFVDFDIHVCTVATDPEKAYKLRESSEKYEIPVINLGDGVIWEGGDMKSQGGGHKINLVKEFIADKKDTDVLLFLDGYDTFFADSLNEIICRYLEMNTEILFSSERICWPDEELGTLLQVHNDNQSSPYQYLNSGMYIGRIGRLKELFDAPIANREDDQLYVQKQYLKNPKGIKCDVEQYILMTHNLSTYLHKGSLFNPITNCYGCLYHGNGGRNQKKHCERLYESIEAPFYIPTKDYMLLSRDILLIDFMREDKCRELIQIAEDKQFKVLEGDVVPAQELRMKELNMWEELKAHWMETVYQIVYDYWYPCHMYGLRDAFIIKYEMDKQRELRLHSDASLVTGSIKLNDDYEGGILEFPRQEVSNKDVPIGKCILFPSQVSHPHTSTQLMSGTKYSLTIWSSRYKGDINC